MIAPALPLTVLLALSLAPAATHAEIRQLPLGPANAEIGFRAYAFGIVPLNGSFSHFSGMLTIDPQTPGMCHVDVQVDVSSLHMPNAALRDDVLSKDLLDAAAFPTFVYSGACRGDSIEGNLTLHGTSHPFNLAIVNAPPRYSAEGTMRRRDWGIAGQTLTVGATVRIRVSTIISH